MSTKFTDAARAALAQFPSDRVPAPDGGGIEIFFFGHASLAFVYGERVVYVDPLSGQAPCAELPEADAILVTHAHSDHFDAQAVTDLAGAETVTILNAAAREALGWGTVLHNGERHRAGDWFDVEAVPACNATPERMQFHPGGGRDNGYRFRLGGLSVYVAGDTEPTPEMGALSGTDLVFLPVDRVYTMSFDQAVEAVRMLRPRIFYPYHTSDAPVERFADELAGTDVEVRIFPMR